MTAMTTPPVGAVNHADRHGAEPCENVSERCSGCGRHLIEHFELTGLHSPSTGQPEYERLHSCPTWVEGWRASRWFAWFALPGYGHDSHDADMPLLTRTYR